MRNLLNFLGSSLMFSTALLACGDDKTETPDAALQADAGVAMDLGAGADTGIDVGIDSGVDAGIDAGPMIPIPDPGNADGDWGFSVSFTEPCCGTPETAYPVGLVNMDPGYVQGNINMENGDFFYVFKTGPAYTVFNYQGGITVEYAHLHEGTGLIFGAELAPTSTSAVGGVWPVQPDTIYILELHSETGGFF